MTTGEPSNYWEPSKPRRPSMPGEAGFRISGAAQIAVAVLAVPIWALYSLGVGMCTDSGPGSYCTTFAYRYLLVGAAIAVNAVAGVGLLWAGRRPPASAPVSARSVAICASTVSVALLVAAVLWFFSSPPR